MSAIHEQTSIHCPFERIPAYLEGYFEAHGARGGVGATIELRVPLGGVNLDHDVIVSIVPLKDFPEHDRLGVGWSPKSGGIFPSFDGTIGVTAEPSGSSCLRLDGSYRAPLGAVGAAFDAALGQRLAKSTARDLLKRLKDAIERAFAKDEGLPLPFESTFDQALD
jgi:carbon monoxide dehydrogenase subunit G